MNLAQKHREIVETFGSLPDAEERLRHVLHFGRRWPALAVARKTEERLLPGCVSRLWLDPEYRDGRCWFGMEAEAAIAKGMAALLCGFYSGETPAEIVATEPDFVAAIDLAALLSPNRSNSLARLRGHIKAFAVRCLARPDDPVSSTTGNTS